MKLFLLATVTGMSTVGLALPSINPPGISSRSLDRALWSVLFSHSSECTGGSSGSLKGVDGLCHKIPAPEYVSGVNFEAADDSVRLHLYSNDDCTGVEGSYSGLKDTAPCYSTNGAKSFKANRIFAKRLDAPQSTIDVAGVSNSTESSELERRYDLGVALMTTGIAFKFAYKSLEVCPYFAEEEDIDKKQCGLAATAAVFSGALAVWEYYGSFFRPAPDNKVKRGLATDYLPVNDGSLIPGWRVSASYIGALPESDGIHWHHYAVGVHDTERNRVHNVTAAFHPEEDRQYVFKAVEDDVVSDGDTNRSLVKRRSVGAYYAWRNEVEAYYDNTPHTSADTDRIALKVWNYGAKTNQGGFCANLRTESSYHPWNQGYYALTAGTFTDYSDRC